MAHMDRILAWGIHTGYPQYDSKRASARAITRVTSLGDAETLCVNVAQKEAIGASVRAYEPPVALTEGIFSLFIFYPPSDFALDGMFPRDETAKWREKFKPSGMSAGPHV